MLRSTKELEKFSIGATDGTVGKVKDFYFDDQAWIVRYLVVETGSWLWLGYRVLIATDLVTDVDWVDSKAAVQLSREAIRNSHVYDESVLDTESDFGIYGGD